MITRVKPMSVEHARCLATAYDLHRLLGELYERPESGSCVKRAWDLVDDVIAYLEPEEAEPDERPTIRSLRLVATKART